MDRLDEPMDNKNRYRLRLSSVIRRQAAEDGVVQDELELLNILPSYQMYRNTVSMNLTPSTDNEEQLLPDYELTPQMSAGSLSSSASNGDYFGQMPASEPNSNINENVEESNETILGNVHKLKRLSSTNKNVSKLLKLQLFFTEKVGKIGVKPKIIDPLSMELKQGDYVYGFILINNNTDKIIPFDLFAVVLEGSEITMNNKQSIVQYPTSVTQFLTMFDFAASYNDANVDRLSDEKSNPHIPMETYDPIDNTRVQLDHKRILKPNITYKKFFAFKLPEKLLDSTCDHGLVNHLQLPSTLGVSKYEAINTLRQKWKAVEEDKVKGVSTPTVEADLNSKLKYSCCTNDFAFPENSISYSISARIIGKESDYEPLFHSGVMSPKPPSHEYVVANEVSAYLRVISSTNSIFELNRKMIVEEARLIYSNMVEKIKGIIAHGKELSFVPQESRDTISSPSLRPTSSSVELSKMSQLYYQKPVSSENGSKSSRSNAYHAIYAHKKKTVFGQSKVLGLAAFNTPRVEYRVSYLQVPKFIKPDSPPPVTKISIPINLEYFNSEKVHSPPPEFRKVSVELIVCTIKSKNLPIPVVIHPDMLFDYKGKGTENFDLLTIKKFQNYAHDISKLMKEHGPQKLDIDKQLIKDIKCLANLAAKYDHLKFQNPSIQVDGSTVEENSITSIPWQTKEKGQNGDSTKHIEYFKSFNINIDMKNLIQSSNPSSDFCLIPDFQFCTLARIYYIKLKFKCPNGEKVYLRVPILIQNMDSPVYTQ